MRYAERMKEKWDRERRERSVKEIKGEKQNLLRYIRLEFVPWTKKSFIFLNLNILFALLSTPFGIPHTSGAVGKIFYTEDGN